MRVRTSRIFSTPAEGAEALHRSSIAGRAIPDAIDTVADADGSALQWRDDWITLLDAVDSYADDLADDPEAEFEPPPAGGGPLMYEMSWVSDVPCEIPPAIMALDAEVRRPTSESDRAGLGGRQRCRHTQRRHAETDRSDLRLALA